MQVREGGIALVIASYLEDAEVLLPPMSIRLTCNTLMDVSEIQEAGKVVRQVSHEVFTELEQSRLKHAEEILNANEEDGEEDQDEEEDAEDDDEYDEE